MMKTLPAIGDDYIDPKDFPGIVSEIVRLGPFWAVRVAFPGRSQGVALIHPEMAEESAWMPCGWEGGTVVIGGRAWFSLSRPVPLSFFYLSWEEQIEAMKAYLVDAGLMRIRQ